MVGPALGGWLFQLGGGPTLPLLVNAGVVLALIPLLHVVVTHCVPNGAGAAGGVSEQDASVEVEGENGDDGARTTPRGADTADAARLGDAEQGVGRDGGGVDEGGGGEGAAGRGVLGEEEEPLAGRVSSSAQRVSVRQLVARPLFIASGLLLLSVSISFGTFPSTLSPHLQRTLHISEGGVGSVYAGVAGLYALFTPLVGPLADRADNGPVGLSTIAIAGVSMVALGHLCFGPSPLLHIPDTWLHGWRLWGLEAVGGGVVYGIGSAFAFVPLLPLMQTSVEDLGQDTAEMTTGIFNGGYYLGELMGQLFGAPIVDLMGFPIASTCIASALICACAVCFLTVRTVRKPPSPTL